MPACSAFHTPRPSLHLPLTSDKPFLCVPFLHAPPWSYSLGGPPMVSDTAMLRTAEAFAAGLAQPLSPRICPFCFALFINTLVPKSHEARLVVTKCHVFFDALMAFICLDWTRDRRETVTSILAYTAVSCNKCKPRGQPRCDVPGVPDIFNAAGFVDLFALVYQVTCGCVHSGVADHIDSGKGFGSKRGRWPTSAEQLFPYGPERSMRSLVSQLGTFSFAESVVTDLVSLHRPLAFPSILLSPTRALFMNYIITRLSACPAAINADLAKLRQPVLPAVRDAIVQRHLAACYYTAMLLYAVAVGPDHHIDEQTFLYSRREQELFAALDAVCLLTHARRKNELYWLELLTTHLWYRMTEAQRDAAGYPCPPPYAREIERTEQIHANPYRALRLYLPEGLRVPARACDGPGCVKTVHDKAAPGAFARCGRCRAVQYCSRECQRADWKRARFPHREICGMLQALLAFVALDFAVTADEFVALCTKHAFPIEYVDKLICWATNGEVVTRYAVGCEPL